MGVVQTGNYIGSRGSRRCGVQHCCPMTSLKPEDAFDPNQVK
ncbi:hypothetical protein WN943_001684 [Citrus x changshan-huyou]